MPETFLESTEQFSRWVRDMSARHRLSRRKLLKLAGLSHGTMSRATKDMSMSTVAHVAHVFGYRLALVPRLPATSKTQKSLALSGEAHGTGDGVSLTSQHQHK